jgi:carboxymethylenebutenolidase
MPDAHIEIEGDDGPLDAFLARPDGLAPRPPVLLLADRRGLRPAFEALARRLAAHGYVVLAPDWTARSAEERRQDAEAWLDHLAGDRSVDDTRVGALGYGAGADLALRLAAWRAERVAAVAAFLGHGFAAAPALAIAERINGLVHLGYAQEGLPGPRHTALEVALCATGVDFEAACYPREPHLDPPLGEAHWLSLLDLFERTLRPARSGTPAAASSWSSQRTP